MQDFVDFKIRQLGNDTLWADVPVAFTLDIASIPIAKTREYCDGLAYKLVRGMNAEVRWENRHIGQGHYLAPWQLPILG